MYLFFLRQGIKQHPCNRARPEIGSGSGGERSRRWRLPHRDARELDSRHLLIDMYSRTTLESLPISDASLIGTPPCLPTTRPSRDSGCGCLKLLTRTPRFRFRSHENKEIDRVDRLSFHQSLKQSRCQPDGCQSVLMTSRTLLREFTRSSFSDY
jgi:hypothetical protein